MLDAKIYGLCIERLKHQIERAKEKWSNSVSMPQDNVLLESYNTGDIEDIIDILEIYDIEEKTFDRLWESLGDLAYTVSLLTQETLFFDFTLEGHLGLFFSMNGRRNSSDAVYIKQGAAVNV